MCGMGISCTELYFILAQMRAGDSSALLPHVVASFESQDEIFVIAFRSGDFGKSWHTWRPAMSGMSFGLTRRRVKSDCVLRVVGGVVRRRSLRLVATSLRVYDSP